MRDYYILNRTDQQSMFRAVTQKPRSVQRLQLKFLSIGEWVEVDADRTPGWNSEGGIGVIVNVTDGLADIRKLKVHNIRYVYIGRDSYYLFVLCCQLKICPHSLGRKAGSSTSLDHDHHAPSAPSRETCVLAPPKKHHYYCAKSNGWERSSLAVPDDE
jgi:hypothetical protein